MHRNDSYDSIRRSFMSQKAAVYAILLLTFAILHSNNLQTLYLISSFSWIYVKISWPIWTKSLILYLNILSQLIYFIYYSIAIQH
jgi:hypothetical protein